MSTGQLTSDPKTMDVHLQANNHHHFGVNGGAHRNSRASEDATLQFLSQEEQECILFFEETIDSLEESLEEESRQGVESQASSTPICEVDRRCTFPPVSSPMSSRPDRPTGPRDQDIIDLVRPGPDLVQDKETLFSPTMLDFQSMRVNPESHFEMRPRRDVVDNLPSEYNPPLPGGGHGSSDGVYHPPGCIPTPVLIAQKIAENQGGGAVNLRPSSLLRRSSLETDKPLSYTANNPPHPVKHGPPTSAKPNRFPGNISMVTHGNKEHHGVANVNIHERKAQMLANLTGAAHPLPEQEPEQTGLQRGGRNAPTRSVSFRDPAPDKSRMEALSKLGLNRNRTLSGDVSKPTPKPTSPASVTDTETSSKPPTPTVPSPTQMPADRKPEKAPLDTVSGWRDQPIRANPSPPATVRNNSPPSPLATVRNNSPPSPPAAVRDTSLPSPPAAVRDNSFPSPPATVRDNSFPLPLATVRNNSPPSPLATVRNNSPPSPLATVRDTSFPLPPSTVRDTSFPLPPSTVRDISFPPPPVSFTDNSFPPPPATITGNSFPPPHFDANSVCPPPEVSSLDFNSYGGKTIVVNPAASSKSEYLPPVSSHDSRALPSAVAMSSDFNSYGGKTKVMNPGPVPRSDLPDILSSHIDRSRAVPSPASSTAKPEFLVPYDHNSYGGKTRTITPSTNSNPLRSHSPVRISKVPQSHSPVITSKVPQSHSPVITSKVPQSHSPVITSKVPQSHSPVITTKVPQSHSPVITSKVPQSHSPVITSKVPQSHSPVITSKVPQSHSPVITSKVPQSHSPVITSKVPQSHSPVITSKVPQSHSPVITTKVPQSHSPVRTSKVPAPSPAPRPTRQQAPSSPHNAVLRPPSPEPRRKSISKPASSFRSQGITVQFSGRGQTDESRKEALRKLGLLKETF